jgi:mannosyl-oligosaccharide alpha-1,2-mannosidase
VITYLKHGHLANCFTVACFDGGNFIFGGMVLGEQKYIDFGLALTAGCRATYTGTATRIGPEIFSWLPAECAAVPDFIGNATLPSTKSSPLRKRKLNAAHNSPYPEPFNEDEYPAPVPTAAPLCSEDPCQVPNEVFRYPDDVPPVTVTVSNVAAPTATVNPACGALPQSQAAFYQANGYYITNGYYDLRPETMESYYYAYRITGDPKYQEWAWDAFVAINKTCRVGAGFSSFRSVDTPGGGSYGNNQESFFFAEVMKYAYMIFAEDGPWQVNHKGNGRDKFVFNTEAHPVKVVFAPL